MTARVMSRTVRASLGGSVESPVPRVADDISFTSCRMRVTGSVYWLVVISTVPCNRVSLGLLPDEVAAELGLQPARHIDQDVAGGDGHAAAGGAGLQRQPAVDAELPPLTVPPSSVTESAWSSR